jgi:hypothetical protein
MYRHLLDRSDRCVKCALEISVHDIVPVLTGNSARRSESGAACVVYQYIDAAELLDGIRNQSTCFDWLADIGLNRYGSASGVLNGSRCSVGAVGIMLVVRDYACAVTRDADGQASTDALACASDYDDLAVKETHFSTSARIGKTPISRS